MANELLTTDILIYKNGVFHSIREQNIFANNRWQEIAARNVNNYQLVSVYNSSNNTWYRLTVPLYIPTDLSSYETNNKEGMTELLPSWEDASYQGQNFKLLNFNNSRFPLICDTNSQIRIQEISYNWIYTNFDEDIEFELVYSNAGTNNWFRNMTIEPLQIFNETHAYQGADITVTPTGTPNNNTLHVEWLAKGKQTGVYYFGVKLQCYTMRV